MLVPLCRVCLLFSTSRRSVLALPGGRYMAYASLYYSFLFIEKEVAQWHSPANPDGYWVLAVPDEIGVPGTVAQRGSR